MNRHLKIAFFMAPLLALLAYGLTGYLIKPQNHSTPPSRMSSSQNCLPRANACVFMAGELQIKLLSNTQQGQLQLALLSNQPVKRVSLALAAAEQFTQFPVMQSDDGKYWQLKLPPTTDLQQFQQLRLALEHQGVAFYAESAVRF